MEQVRKSYPEGRYTSLDVSYWSIYAPPTMHGILISLSRLRPPPSHLLLRARSSRGISVSLSLSHLDSRLLRLPFSVCTPPRGASSANETLVSYRRLVPAAFTIELPWNHPRDSLMPALRIRRDDTAALWIILYFPSFPGEPMLYRPLR